LNAHAPTIAIGRERSLQAKDEPSVRFRHPLSRGFGREVEEMLTFKVSPTQFGIGGAKLDKRLRIAGSNFPTSAAKSSTGVLDPPPSKRLEMPSSPQTQIPV